jgi:hypothetical protein
MIARGAIVVNCAAFPYEGYLPDRAPTKKPEHQGCSGFF